MLNYYRRERIVNTRGYLWRLLLSIPRNVVNRSPLRLMNVKVLPDYGIYAQYQDNPLTENHILHLLNEAPTRSEFVHPTEARRPVFQQKGEDNPKPPIHEAKPVKIKYCFSSNQDHA